MQVIRFKLKVAVESLEELKSVFEKIREIEKEYGAKCVDAEIEIISKWEGSRYGKCKNGRWHTRATY